MSYLIQKQWEAAAPVTCWLAACGMFLKPFCKTWMWLHHLQHLNMGKHARINCSITNLQPTLILQEHFVSSSHMWNAASTAAHLKHTVLEYSQMNVFCVHCGPGKKRKSDWPRWYRHSGKGLNILKDRLIRSRITSIRVLPSEWWPSTDNCFYPQAETMVKACL